MARFSRKEEAAIFFNARALMTCEIWAVAMGNAILGNDCNKHVTAHMYDNVYWSCNDVDPIVYSALQNKQSLKKIQTVLDDESQTIVLNISLLFQYRTSLVILC